ncbi:hypothetical protein ACQKQD_31555 [Methylobacterium sp. NPDC080182]|uniref:hypothetical protein n=1 Tax=Methylobacterium sp. NPDC080182 TaxID=3390590 RepID=UPI003D078CEE
MNLRDLILPPGDTIDREGLDKAAAYIEAARTCGAEAIDIVEGSYCFGGVLPSHQDDPNVVLAFQLISDAVRICENSRDFHLMALVNCLRYDPINVSYLDLIYQEIIEFIAERDCGDEVGFRARCLLSSIVRIEVAASAMSIRRSDRRKLHSLLAEARYNVDDIRIDRDSADRDERLEHCYSSLKKFWGKLNGTPSVWD